MAVRSFLRPRFRICLVARAITRFVPHPGFAVPDPAESTSAGRVFIGCAGWTLPLAVQPAFVAEGTHLQRYATRFPAAEINTTFYRPHRPSTYTRWMESVPADFRFCVKIPKAITHEARLRDADDALATFLAEAGALGPRLACLLIQLPPSFAFDAAVAEPFFAALRSMTPLAAVCEPRHATWFTGEAEALLDGFRVARVAADPARVPAAGEPGGWRGMAYYRLHGSPRVYYSSYEDAYLDALAARIRQDVDAGREVWCIFDNTASGAAAQNALDLQARLADLSRGT